jgi:hypothetical protein
MDASASTASEGKRKPTDAVVPEDSDNEQHATSKAETSVTTETTATSSSALPSRAEMERERLARVEAMRTSGQLSASSTTTTSARPGTAKKPRIETLSAGLGLPSTSHDFRSSIAENTRYYEGTIKPTFNIFRQAVEDSVTIEQVVGPVRPSPSSSSKHNTACKKVNRKNKEASA